MRLPLQETERFYRIWFALLHYVNTQLHLVPSFPAAPGEQDVSPEVTIQVRDALWAHDDLRQQFIADNPAHAYGVLGLVSTIEETVPLPLPVFTQAVLLPFEHHITYDSLFTSYNVVFGSGYRQNLQEMYRNIQEREGIMTSLLPEDQAAREGNQRTDILARNRKVFSAFRRELGKAGLIPQTVETHIATIVDFASSVLLNADPPRGVLDLTFADIESYLRGKPGKQALTSFKRFARFLLSTGRIDYEMGENLSDLLKHRTKGN
jgi:hypothetical protein